MNLNPPVKTMLNGSLFLSSLNINGIKDKMSILMTLLSNDSTDIIGLQETHSPDNHSAQFTNYIYYSSGTTINKWSGVAFLIKNKLKKYIIKFVPITERIAVLYLNTAYKPTILLNVYVPPKLTERMLFLEHLDNMISSLPKRYNIIAMGDFDTKIGHDITYKVSKTIGHTTVYSSNDKDGKKLLQICFDNNLKKKNTFFKHKPPHLMTFTRGGHSSQIYFFLSNIHNWFADVKAILNINISDHKLIKAHIIIRSDEWRNNNTRRLHSTYTQRQNNLPNGTSLT
ncbi:unnamed protein product [Gordionus sp. m RMFG-2023]